MKYLVSIKDEDFKQNPEYSLLSYTGQMPFGRNTISQNIGLSYDNQKIYFITNGEELGQLIYILLNKINNTTEIMVQKASREALPNDLAEMYQKLYDYLLHKDK